MAANKEKCPERLSAVIQWCNLSANSFSERVGLKNGENIYQVLRGNNGISRRLATAISQTYPEINPTWLMTGNGAMFIKAPGNALFYDVDAELNITSLPTLIADFKAEIPIPLECDFAMRYCSEAMAGSIPRDAIVFFKEVTPEQIALDKEYLVVCEDFSMLRIAKRATTKSCKQPAIKLVSTERKRFSDLVIPIAEIKNVYLVVAKLITNN